MSNIRTSPLGRWLLLAALLAAAGLAWWGLQHNRHDGPGPGFVSGNGRLEATEVDVATRMGGRLLEVLVREGDFVSAGQPLARMQSDSLTAQRNEALANQQRARHAVAAAQAQVALRESDVAAAQALQAQREAELDNAQRRLVRTQALAKEGATSAQQLDDDRAAVRGVQAALAATRAQIAAARAAVEAARAELVGARSAVQASSASIERIDADLRDSELRAPRDGRVQLRLAEPGEVLGAGGRVLNLIDVSDVFMTFFLPEAVAGRVPVGSEARIVLDAARDVPLPATISFIASQAQFTPKTVETASEREKLMFRVKARVPPELLRRHAEQVKVGLPGVAWVRLDATTPWPAGLQGRLTE